MFIVQTKPAGDFATHGNDRRKYTHVVHDRSNMVGWTDATDHAKISGTLIAISRSTNTSFVIGIATKHADRIVENFIHPDRGSVGRIRGGVTRGQGGVANSSNSTVLPAAGPAAGCPVVERISLS